jgi:hypothetical protein
MRPDSGSGTGRTTKRQVPAPCFRQRRTEAGVASFSASHGPVDRVQADTSPAAGGEMQDCNDEEASQGQDRQHQQELEPPSRPRTPDRRHDDAHVEPTTADGLISPRSRRSVRWRQIAAVAAAKYHRHPCQGPFATSHKQNTHNKDASTCYYASYTTVPVTDLTASLPNGARCGLPRSQQRSSRLGYQWPHPTQAQLSCRSETRLSLRLSVPQ